MKYPIKVIMYTSFDTDFTGGGEAPSDQPFTYSRGGWARRALSFLLYRLIATPIAALHSALVLRQRIVGRKKLRSHRSFLLVGNHNERCGDAFSPSLVSFPRRCYVVVHHDNVRLPVLGKVTPLLGAVPIPRGMKEAREFSQFVEARLEEGSAVMIYPEAHLWEKCSFLRPFEPTAFDPAVRGGYPVFSATRVYRSHKLLGYVTHLYIDGPFYPDTALSRSAAARELSERVHRAMSERVLESDACIIEYRLKEEE